MSELRRHLRYLVQVKVKVKGETQEEMLSTNNISAGGLCLLSPKPPRVGTILEMEILHSEEGPKKTKAEVVWRKEHEACGVRFLKPTAAFSKALNAYLNALTEE